jgi:hypothetical protein
MPTHLAGPGIIRNRADSMLARRSPNVHHRSETGPARKLARAALEEPRRE